MGNVTTNTLSISELAKLSGLSAHTLRFYETEGILQPVRRAKNGHRQYCRNDVLWLEFVLRLKLTGMPLAEIKQYALLRMQGETTLESRLAMLKLHQQRLVTKINELSTCAGMLDEKIRTYQTLIDNVTAPAPKVAK
ncbi:DNA-binding transcriptional MerR regulator [Chitinivorax tropicus]|uniref:DNA-binding transcriptional MerR regulator n=1 Tax=Chitinivorax tropicus TaxID=714531 RepID=A0A840MI30_9PROT|nr:MerR family transcriptional regulator [Chitinivorax tropicus]MBB5018308.1 DNA-binding transcriptional MerR regulator [Chitinivorax tropicus]